MVNVYLNVFDKGTYTSENFEGILLDYIYDRFRSEFRSSSETKLIINGVIIEVESYKDLEIYVMQEDKVEVIIVPQFMEAIGIIIKMLIVAIIQYILMKFFAEDEAGTEKTRSLYNFDLNEIRSKQDGIIDENFGTFIVYPKLISKPYIRYEGNEEIVYLSTVVGVGEYYFNEMYINKTPVQDIVFDNNRTCDGVNQDKVLNCISPNNDILKVYRFTPYDNSLDGVDSKYRYIIKECEAMDNFDLFSYSLVYNYITTHVYHNTNLATLPASLNNDFKIDKIEIDISCQSLYLTDDEGDKHSTFIGFAYKVFKYDEFGNKITVKQGEKTLNGLYTQPQRRTFELDLPLSEGYFIELYDRSYYNEDKNVVNNWKIDRIKALSPDYSIRTDNVTYAIFRLQSGTSAFNSLNKMNIGLKVERKGLTKMNDVVNYIWDQSGYNFLELSDSQELMSRFDVHGAIDSQDSLINQINKILKPQQLNLLPTLNGLKIKLDWINDVKTYVFDKSNIVRDTLEIQYKSYDTSINDGFKTTYFDIDGEKQSYTFPANSTNPRETIAFGIRDNTDAERMSRVGYQKTVASNKMITFETDLRGMIPDLEDKIGVAEYYINDTGSSNIMTYNGLKLILEKEVYLDGGEYAIIKNENLSIDSTYLIINSEVGFVREIELEGFNPATLGNTKAAVIIGKEQSMLKEYIVKEINQKTKSTVEIKAQNYSEEVFTGEMI